jgi:hypothetical protein
MLLTVIRRHGPAERASHLLLTLHSGLGRSVHRITATDDASLVAVHDLNGVAVVHVDDTVLPAPIARALEGWIAEMFSRNVGSACRSNTSACSNSSGNINASALRNQHKQSRRLLFFQELVVAVEMRYATAGTRQTGFTRRLLRVSHRF